ncbi:hypothetical protein ACHQM5_022647 [Ranunculus cassubicifolius]
MTNGITSPSLINPKQSQKLLARPLENQMSYIYYSLTDLRREHSAFSQNLARKCEALAVSGLAECGDEIDVVAPADILKQIFKIPYSKARLSIAVHRIGQTLVLNSGPDIEEGEKIVRRHNSQSKCPDNSLFLNFAMHSVRAEACDCPSTQYAKSEEEPNPSILSGHYESTDGSFLSSEQSSRGDTSGYLSQRGDNVRKDGLRNPVESPNATDAKCWNSKRNNKTTRKVAVKKGSTSQVGEKIGGPVQESEKCRRIGNNGFLRILFWQFYNFHMLLGSDLLVFSNDKYVAVSLHLWDVTRQVTPLTWLEAWLDNVMASVPELAICYHQNGVVQGYELLKTDDIFLLKGISEDGTPAFHPQVVQQNGHSVLRFLQDNCTQDPGAYWLYKNAGDDVIQLFDLSVIPKSRSPEEHDRSSSTIPSQMYRGRRDSLSSLGTLLFRLAHRLSLSMVSSSRAKCARLFKKCFDFLDEQDHLVVRALAHEQFARLMLTCYDIESETIDSESDATVIDAKNESSYSSMEISGSDLRESETSQAVEDMPSVEGVESLQESISDEEPKRTSPQLCVYAPKIFPASEEEKVEHLEGPMSSSCSDTVEMCQISETVPQFVQTVPDPISTKLAAIHHVSQAIKSLRWKRQLQTSEAELIDHGKATQDRSSPINFSLCACGDADCIEVCDIREWLPQSKMDGKLWKLVLLLGESYLALGEAYKERGQLLQALKVVDVACSIYGSMPQYLDNAQFISSMVRNSSLQSKSNVGGRPTGVSDGITELNLRSDDTIDQSSSTYLFWANAWTLVGDVYVEYQMTKSTEAAVLPEKSEFKSKVRISTEVEKEVKRLKKKLGQFKQNCSTCSLINCSCQSDRASSGNSASSSNGEGHKLTHGRKQIKRSNAKISSVPAPRISEDEPVGPGMGSRDASDSGYLKKIDNNPHLKASKAEVAYTVEIHDDMSTKSTDSAAKDEEPCKGRNGGIFKFLEGPIVGELYSNLSIAINCYDAAKKALSGLPTGSSELHSVLKKKGWVCNELGRNWLGKKDLEKAELAFADAIKSFKEVSDHTNIILINCNLGHGRRALAEEMVSKILHLKNHAFLQDAYNQALETAKLEYSESLRYYAAARSELNIVDRSAGSITISSSLRNDVYTQLAHTYLRLGMFLAREDITTKVYENGTLEDLLICYVNPCDKRARKNLRKREVSANDAIREAISIYESLGELRKQEAAYAYFQLGCYHRDSCLKFLHQNILLSKKGDKVKQYASLAERNWQKSVDFYGPTTHPAMYLTILIERSTLSWKLYESFHSNAMLESALLRLLDARHLSAEETTDSMINNQEAEIDDNYKSQLQGVLKKMLQVALSSGSTSKSSSGISQAGSGISKSGDVAKLRELYGMSLKLRDMRMLHGLYRLWMS